MIENLIKKEITHYGNNNGEIPVSEEELIKASGDVKTHSLMLLFIM